MLLDAGVAPVGDPTQCHAVAIDARSPKFDGGIATRLDCIVFGVVVNRDAQRFYDEGEDVWPKRYAIWGRLIAQQPDQIGYTIFDSRSLRLFMPSIYPAIEAGSIRELAGKLSLDPEALEKTLGGIQRRGAARHLRSHRSRRLPHGRADAAEDALGAHHRASRLITPIRCGPASPSPISACA